MTSQEQPRDKQNQITAESPMKIWMTQRRLRILIAVAALVISALLGGWIRPFDGFTFGGPTSVASGNTHIATEMSSTDTTLGTDIKPNYGDSKRYCPDATSAEAQKSKESPLRIDNVTDEDFLVMGDRPVVHIISSASPGGMIRLCGGPGQLVISGVHFGMSVYFGNANSRIVVVDPEVGPGADFYDPEKVFVVGGMTVQTLYCTTQGRPELRPCSSFDLVQ